MEELRNSPNAASAPQRRGRTHGWVGLLLIATCWPLRPRVFRTAELAASFKWVEPFTFRPRVRHTAVLELAFFLAGKGMLLLTVAWPKCYYPFVLTSLVLILEPQNRWLGREHFME